MITISQLEDFLGRRVRVDEYHDAPSLEYVVVVTDDLTRSTVKIGSGRVIIDAGQIETRICEEMHERCATGLLELLTRPCGWGLVQVRS